MILKRHCMRIATEYHSEMQYLRSKIFLGTFLGMQEPTGPLEALTKFRSTDLDFIPNIGLDLLDLLDLPVLDVLHQGVGGFFPS